MKRLLILLLVMLLSLTVLVSCFISPNQDHQDTENENQTDEKLPEDENDENIPEEKPEEKPDEAPKYKYTDFSPSEKELFIEIVGEVIPFLPSNEYYVEEYDFTYDDEYEHGVNYYIYGLTNDEFDAYIQLFSSFTFDGSELDGPGEIWYYYTSPLGYYVDIEYCNDGTEQFADIYAYTLNTDADDGESDTDGGYNYTDFTANEKKLFDDIVGGTIPFLPSNEYYVEEYTMEYEEDYEYGVNYYIYGLKQSDFDSYRKLFSDYSFDGSDQDSYGDTWYYYTAKAGFYVDMSYYHDGEEYVIDIYVYYLYEYGEGDTGGGDEESDILTNYGAGLPEGNDGIYNINFADGKYVTNVTEQGTYLGGCPTVGSPKVLVIPVDFSDVLGINKGYSIDNIVRAFCGSESEVDYYSVDEYYYISSYGKLDLDITVIDQWFVPKNPSSYYENATMDYYGDQVFIGDQIIMDEALDYLDDFMDLSEFDSDKNGIIDAVVLINTLTIDEESDFRWAYRYWNIYTDEYDSYFEYDGVSANDYLWASYLFMHEVTYEDGDVDYTNTAVMNTYTYIHEFGHILGADDYYDTDGEYHPLEGLDIMDSMMGDHNAFTKFNLGWITSSRLVTAKDKVTLSLEKFSESGDSIIIACNWDPDLSAYQEYYVVVYYTRDGLNGGDYGYFLRDGVVVYHINASLIREEYAGEVYYDIYNNNTNSQSEYGSENNLIEFVKSSEGNFTYVEGDTLPSVTDDSGNLLPYTFVIDEINESGVILTFSKV